MRSVPAGVPGQVVEERLDPRTIKSSATDDMDGAVDLFLAVLEDKPQAQRSGCETGNNIHNAPNRANIVSRLECVKLLISGLSQSVPSARASRGE